MESEFALADFQRIARFAKGRTGIHLDIAKSKMVQSRLAGRLKANGISSFSKYADILESGQGSHEQETAISLLTTNVTSFFREPHHFKFLRNHLWHLKNTKEPHDRIRIWSAGCSFGNEAYSIAMLVLDVFGTETPLDIRILATDIDRSVLRHASIGRFPDGAMTGVPEHFKKANFHTDNKGHWQVSRELRDLVHFKHLNLIGPWPMQKTFDVIFCRNTLIYFDQTTQAEVFSKLTDKLSSGGILAIGHSERLTQNVRGFFRPVGTTLHQRTVG